MYRKFKKNELLESLKNKISEKPYLGICLGLQVLFSVSEESLGDQGLNIFPEKIERFIDSKN
jgi:imidazoleglycerol phosphate synthase glutamine amidotransferase subunit HisH